MLRINVGLMHTSDMKKALVKCSELSVLDLATSHLMMTTFMTIHLSEFRFDDTDQLGP